MILGTDTTYLGSHFRWRWRKHHAGKLCGIGIYYQLRFISHLLERVSILLSLSGGASLATRIQSGFNLYFITQGGDGAGRGNLYL